MIPGYFILLRYYRFFSVVGVQIFLLIILNVPALIFFREIQPALILLPVYLHGLEVWSIVVILMETKI